MKRLALVLFILGLISCNGEMPKPLSESEATQHEKPTFNFDKTTFTDRTEELLYIREYIRLNAAKAYLRKNPESVKKMREYYATVGKNYSSEETAERLINADQVVTMLSQKAMSQNLSYKFVKQNLYNLIPAVSTSVCGSTKKAIDDLLSSSNHGDNDIIMPVDSLTE